MRWYHPKNRLPRHEQEVILWWPVGYDANGFVCERKKDKIVVARFIKGVGFIGEQKEEYPVGDTRMMWCTWRNPRTMYGYVGE